MALAVDTHALIWYLLRSTKLSPAAWAALRSTASEGEPIYVPSISLVEIRYLVERNRFPETTLERAEWAVENEATVLTLVPLTLGVTRAMAQVPRLAVPEMPDRIIAATALALGVPLVTRDLRIRASPVQVLW